MRFYFTEEVPNSTPTFLNVQSAINLAAPVPSNELGRISRYVARKAVMSLKTAGELFRNPEWLGIDVLNAVKRLGVDARLALSDAGYQAVYSPVDKSIHPIVDDLEYDPKGKVSLTENAERCGMMRVHRVELSMGYHPAAAYHRSIASATRDADATGALRSSPTEQPPGFHDRESRSQNSTTTVSPSVVDPRTSNPSTNRGSSVTSGSATSDTVPYSGTSLKIGDRHPATGRPVYHETDDLGELMDRAKAAFPGVIDVLKRATGMVPGAVFKEPGNGEKGMARVKTDLGRVREKLANGRAPSNLSDLIGARVHVDNLDQIPELINHLSTISGAPIPPQFHQDFTTGLGREGYRAYHVQVPYDHSGTSFETQIMPREIGEVQHEAHKHYDKFRANQAPLHEVQEAKHNSSKIFNDAWGRYVKRVTGAKQDVGQDDSVSNVHLNIQHPVDRESDPTTKFSEALLPLGVNDARTIGEAYMQGLSAFQTRGEGRAELHTLFLSAGIDGIHYRLPDGRKAWIPMSSEQIYDAGTGRTESSRIHMSEFAEKQGYILVDRQGLVQLTEDDDDINPEVPTDQVEASESGEKKTCSVCGKAVTTSKDGAINSHISNVPPHDRCKGSFKAPKDEPVELDAADGDGVGIEMADDITPVTSTPTVGGGKKPKGPASPATATISKPTRPPAAALPNIEGG